MAEKTGKHICVMAGRGGVGKSTFALELAKKLDAYLITNDPTSRIDLMYPDTKYDKKIEIYDNDEYTFVYDFAGHLTPEMVSSVKKADLVIFLTDSTNHSISGTTTLLNELKDKAKDCFVIANKLGFDRTEFNFAKVVTDYTSLKTAFAKYNVDILPFRHSGIAIDSLEIGIPMAQITTTLKGKPNKNYLMEYKQLEHIIKRVAGKKHKEIIYRQK